MLSLIVGVVTMHSTIACHADNGTAPATHDTAHPPATSPAASTFLGPAFDAPDPTPAPEPMTTTASLDGHPHVAMTDDGEAIRPSSAPEHDLAPAGRAVVSPAASLLAPLIALSGFESSQPNAPSSALHDLLHLCLAVLTALLAFAAAALLALLAWRGTRRHASTTGGRPVAGPRAPPPTSVRLAQLCVLRN